MGYSNLNFVVCGLLLPAMTLGQHVVTVSVGTCLTGLESASFLSTGTFGPSAISTVTGVMSNTLETSASTSLPSTPSSTPAGFLISYQAPSNSRMRRRAAAMFPTLDGQSTSACIHSPLFNVDPAGQLSVVNAGTSLTYSTSGNVTSAPFTPSSNIDTISTTWELAAGTLSWDNSAFYNGTASLCTDATGVVQAYFLAPIPADCTPLLLSQTSVSTCPGYFVANPNGQLAPFTPSPIVPSSSVSSSIGAATGPSPVPTSPEPFSTSSSGSDITSSSESELSSASLLFSQFTVSSDSVFPLTSVVTGQNSSSPVLGFSSTSVVTSSSTGPSSFILPSPSSASFSIASSTLGNSSSVPSLPASPFIPNYPTPTASIIPSSLPVISNATSFSASSIVTSLPTILNSTSATLGVNSPSTIASSPSTVNSTITPTGTSASSITVSSTSGVSTSITVSSSSTGATSIISVVTILSTISSGSSLYTTYLSAGSQTVTEEFVQPTPFTTTVASGTNFYTTSTILGDGQEEVEVIEPASTTITSFTATTTPIHTVTNTAANGQVIYTVIEPSPGMQYFGFTDPGDADAPHRPEPSPYNNKPVTSIDKKGVFPADINFYTDANGNYQFPGQTVTTNAANYVLVLEGYFYGPAGDYLVTLDKSTDDYSYLWCDTSAYANWNGSNYYIVEANSENGNGYTQNHTFTLQAGQFVPMTIVWINVHLSGGVRFYITPPNGGSVITDTTGWFVQPYTGDSFAYHV